MSDPMGKGPVTIELNPTLAELLVRLCAELDTEDYLGVMSRALGLLDLAQKSRRTGRGRLCFVNDNGDAAEVVY